MRAEKKYKLQKEQILRMIPDMGFAYVSDKIAVDGNKVDFMYRIKPEKKGDSGWVFYGGGESQEYIDNPENISVLSVNVIANYDEEIIPFLTYPPGTKIERIEGSLQLLVQPAVPPEMTLLPPVEAGEVGIGEHWQVSVAERMCRRTEGGDLVIWRPGITLYFNVMKKNEQSDEDIRKNLIDNRSAASMDFTAEEVGALKKYRYTLVEDLEGKSQSSVYFFAISREEVLLVTIYYDSEEFLPEIERLWSSISFL
jgi:hypothetical protein